MFEVFRFISFFVVGAYVAMLYYFQCSLIESFIITIICGVLIYACITFSFKDIYLDTLLNQHGLPNIFENTNKFHDPGSSYFGYSTTYGEIMSSGMSKIADIANTEDITIFMDMGSGIGKAVIMAKLYGFERSIGIEVVTIRHNQALSLTEKLPDRLQHGIELYNLDIFNFDFSGINKPMAIFASNILWSKVTTKDMFTMIAKRCKIGTLVFVSQFDFHEDDKAVFEKYAIVSLPMSWDWQSVVYVYQLI